jgi:hypothetical protein
MVLMLPFTSRVTSHDSERGFAGPPLMAGLHAGGPG